MSSRPRRGNGGLSRSFPRRDPLDTTVSDVEPVLRLRVSTTPYSAINLCDILNMSLFRRYTLSPPSFPLPLFFPSPFRGIHGITDLMNETRRLKRAHHGPTRDNVNFNTVTKVILGPKLNIGRDVFTRGPTFDRRLQNPVVSVKISSQYSVPGPPSRERTQAKRSIFIFLPPPLNKS